LRDVLTKWRRIQEYSLRHYITMATDTVTPRKLNAWCRWIRLKNT